MEHSTPTTSPSRNDADLRALSLSPIENEGSSGLLGKTVRSVSIVSPKSVQYIDEWVMEQSRCTEYLAFIDSSIIEDNSSASEESSYDSYVSLDTVKSDSNLHEIDDSFFRVWVEADSMESQMCFLEECTPPTEEKQEDTTTFDDYDVTGDSQLDELVQAGANIKRAVAHNKSLQEVPFAQIQMKKGGAHLDLRQVQSAPRPTKPRRPSLFKRLMGRG